MDKYDLAALLLRVGFGASLFAHGYNKSVSPSGLKGTANWFASIGMKWPALQARVASWSEMMAGVMLVLGILTPLAAAATIALMVVAIATVHWRVGYFIFLPNGGWEYCGAIVVAMSALCVIGPGSISIDNALNMPTVSPYVTLLVGPCAALCHLALTYRPEPQ